MPKSAMIECPACQNRLSATAVSCPSCGAVLRKARRGVFGKIIVFLFWGFNALMAVWIWAGSNAAIKGQEAFTEAEKAGAAIGKGIGISMLLILWVMGAVILGLMALLTRPKM